MLANVAEQVKLTIIQKIVIGVLVLLFIGMAVTIGILAFSNMNKERQIKDVYKEKDEAIEEIRQEAEETLKVHLDSILVLNDEIQSIDRELAKAEARAEVYKQREKEHDGFIKELRGNSDAIISELNRIQSSIQGR